MSDEIVIETLRREISKKSKQIEKLEKLMTEPHLSAETAKLMDGFARRFNTASTVKERLAISSEWKKTSDQWKEQVRKARYQNDNFMKWMESQHTLTSEVCELQDHLSMLDLRASLRSPQRKKERTA